MTCPNVSWAVEWCGEYLEGATLGGRGLAIESRFNSSEQMRQPLPPPSCLRREELSWAFVGRMISRRWYQQGLTGINPLIILGVSTGLSLHFPPSNSLKTIFRFEGILAMSTNLISMVVLVRQPRSPPAHFLQPFSLVISFLGRAFFRNSYQKWELSGAAGRVYAFAVRDPCDPRGVRLCVGLANVLRSSFGPLPRDAQSRHRQRFQVNGFVDDLIRVCSRNAEDDF